MTGQRGGGRGRRGEDPEGGERSAWKGFVGPSGLGLDHSRIPEIEKKVYDTLLPLVFRAEHPIPLSQFTQAACDVLLPVLPTHGGDITEHGFKSQWGRLNEFVCPKLAELRGLGDCCFNRAEKTVQLSLAADPPPGFTPTATSRGSGALLHPGAAGGSEGGGEGGEEQAAGGGGRRRRGKRGGGWGNGPGAAVEADGGGAAGGGQSAQNSTPLPVPLAPSPPVGAPAPTHVAAVPAAQPQPQPQPVTGLCLYCGQGYHVIKQCPDFHTMLQSIYQAGYQQGVAAAQQVQQAQQYVQVPASATTLQYP